MLAEVYDALKDAGASEEKARAAAGSGHPLHPQRHHLQRRLPVWRFYLERS